MPTPFDQPSPEPPRRDHSLLPAARGLQASLKRSASVAGASYALIGAIVLLGGAGYLADQWLDTAPWLLFIGLMVGMVVGFYELARVVWRPRP